MTLEENRVTDNVRWDGGDGGDGAPATALWFPSAKKWEGRKGDMQTGREKKNNMQILLAQNQCKQTFCNTENSIILRWLYFFFSSSPTSQFAFLNFQNNVLWTLMVFFLALLTWHRHTGQIKKVSKTGTWQSWLSSSCTTDGKEKQTKLSQKQNIGTHQCCSAQKSWHWQHKELWGAILSNPQRFKTTAI